MWIEKNITKKFKIFYFPIDKDFSKFSKIKYSEFRYALYFFLERQGTFTFLSEIFRNSVDHAKKGWFLIFAVLLKNYKLVFFFSRSIGKLSDNTFSIRNNVKQYKIGMPMIIKSAKFWKIKFLWFDWNYIGFLKVKEKPPKLT